MEPVESAATLGAGVIGASWTALFLASGLRVNVYDPAAGAGERLRAYDAGLCFGEALAQSLYDGVGQETAGEPTERVTAERDTLIVAFLRGRDAVASNQ